MAAAQADRDPSIERVRSAIQLIPRGVAARGSLRHGRWPRAALNDRHLGLLLTFARLQEQDGDSQGAIASLQEALLVEPPARARTSRAHADLRLHRAPPARAWPVPPAARSAPPRVRRRSGRRDAARFIRTSSRGGSAGTIAATWRLAAQIRVGPGRQPPTSAHKLRGPGARAARGIGLVRRHRLVTLTGPGGCGKTRLALEAAAALRSGAADGVWLVELAGLSDAALVAHAVGAALGVQSRSARPAQDAVAAHVADRETLIVLDNCEHVVTACMNLVEVLLRACPNLRILATSREPLSRRARWIGGSLRFACHRRRAVRRARFRRSSPFALPRSTRLR